MKLKSVIQVLITTIQWAIVWGLSGAAAGAIMTTIDPDTGHIPRELVPVMVGVPGALFGAVAGLVFGSLMATAQIHDLLGRKGRTALGGFVGAIAGIVFMNVFAHSLLTIVLAAFLGALLGMRFATGSKSEPGKRANGA